MQVVPCVNSTHTNTHQTSCFAQSHEGNLQGCQLVGKIILLHVNMSDFQIERAIVGNTESHYTISFYF